MKKKIFFMTAIAMLIGCNQSMTSNGQEQPQSKTDSVTVTNTGGGTLSISSIASNNARYTVSPTTASLAASVAQKSYITFVPTSAVSEYGTISYTDNANGSPHTVTASANNTTVTTVVPAKNALNVATTTTVQITFSAAMLTTSFNATTSFIVSV